MPRRRWEDNITIDLKKKSVNTRKWVDSAQDRESPCEPSDSISYGVNLVDNGILLAAYLNIFLYIQSNSIYMRNRVYVAVVYNYES